MFYLWQQTDFVYFPIFHTTCSFIITVFPLISIRLNTSMFNSRIMFNTLNNSDNFYDTKEHFLFPFLYFKNNIHGEKEIQNNSPIRFSIQFLHTGTYENCNSKKLFIYCYKYVSYAFVYYSSTHSILLSHLVLLLCF